MRGFTFPVSPLSWSALQLVVLVATIWTALIITLVESAHFELRAFQNQWLLTSVEAFSPGCLICALIYSVE